MPNNIAPGSIVDITVGRNESAEESSAAAFQSLQKRILNTYGMKSPSPPVLRLRNATQTSLVLGWDPIELATASIKSLSLYRNGSKAGSIPRPLETRSTKISGLAIHTEYTFQLVLRTTAGTYQSEKLKCRTHKMTDLSGITVAPGIMPPQQRDALGATLDRIGGRLVDSVSIDTTHFVCTEVRGPMWEKAIDMNIPVVHPEWVEACEAEGTLVSVRGYYLNADPKTRKFGRPQQQRGASASATSVVTPTPSSPGNQPSAQHEPERGETQESTDEKKDEKQEAGGESAAQPPPNDEEKENEKPTEGAENEKDTEAKEEESHGQEEDKVENGQSDQPAQVNGNETEEETEKQDGEETKETEEAKPADEETGKEVETSQETEEKPQENASKKKSGKQRGNSELSDVPL